ncbi:MAG: TlpA family protein disulfide reductase [Gammaproteobacteria bacterium]
MKPVLIPLLLAGASIVATQVFKAYSLAEGLAVTAFVCGLALWRLDRSTDRLIIIGAADVERFRKKYFPEFFTYARQGSEIDELASVIDPSWNEVVPTTYLINREGKVVARIQGKKSADEFRAALQKLL